MQSNTASKKEAHGTGAEWAAFLKDETIWTPRAYHDDVLLLVDGVPHSDLDAVPVAGLIYIECGYVVFEDSTTQDLLALFLGWKEKQTTTRLVIRVAHDKLEAVKAAVEAAGGTVEE